MKAKFTRGTDHRLGIRFEPETFDEQLLLEMFTESATRLGHEFRFGGWEQNNPGRVLREGLTSVWGEIVERPAEPTKPTEPAAEDK